MRPTLRRNKHNNKRLKLYVPLVSRYQQLGEPLDLKILNQELCSWLEGTGNQYD